jgi:hypothetical protein
MTQGALAQHIRPLLQSCNTASSGTCPKSDSERRVLGDCIQTLIGSRGHAAGDEPLGVLRRASRLTATMRVKSAAQAAASLLFRLKLATSPASQCLLVALFIFGFTGNYFDHPPPNAQKRSDSDCLCLRERSSLSTPRYIRTSGGFGPTCRDSACPITSRSAFVMPGKKIGKTEVWLLLKSWKGATSND